MHAVAVAEQQAPKALRVLMTLVLCLSMIPGLAIPQKAYAAQGNETYYTHGTISQTVTDESGAELGTDITLEVGQSLEFGVFPYQHVQYAGCNMSRCMDYGCDDVDPAYTGGSSCFEEGMGCRCDKTPVVRTTNVDTQVSGDADVIAMGDLRYTSLTASASTLGTKSAAAMTWTAMKPGTVTITVKTAMNNIVNKDVSMWDPCTKTYTITVAGPSADENIIAGDTTVSKGGTYAFESGLTRATVTVNTNEPVEFVGEGLAGAALNYVTINAVVPGANITINGVKMYNANEQPTNALKFTGARNTLTVKGQNQIQVCYNNGDDRALINVPKDGGLTINGDGELYMYKHSYNAAAIGSNNGEACGDVIIDGPRICATGVNGGCIIGGESMSQASGKFVFESGEIAASPSKDQPVICGFESVVLNGGTLNADYSRVGVSNVAPAIASYDGKGAGTLTYNGGLVRMNPGSNYDLATADGEGNATLPLMIRLDDVLGAAAATADDGTASAYTVTLDGTQVYSGDMTVSLHKASEGDATASNPSTWPKAVSSEFFLLATPESHVVDVNGTSLYVSYSEEDGFSVSTEAPADVPGGEPKMVDGAYQLASEADLRWFADKTQEDATLSAVLTADIALEDGILPALGVGFSGTFDGAGHAISGITSLTPGNVPTSATATRPHYAFAPSLSGGTIKNLALEGTATADSYAGVFVGGAVSGTVENCTNRVSLTANSLRIGGIVGYVSGSTSNAADSVITISNCSNEGALSYSGTSASVHIGGIVGEGSPSTTTRCELRVSDCENRVAISVPAKSAGMGGIVGYLSTNNILPTIERCANVGVITMPEPSSDSNAAGGIVGMTSTAATSITDCFNAGGIELGAAKGYSGGIVGSMGSYDPAITLFRVHNVGSISGGKGQGALVGRGAGASVDSAYYLDSSCPNGSNNIYGSSKTVDEMKSLASELDEGRNVWMQGKDGYPVLGAPEVVISAITYVLGADDAANAESNPATYTEGTEVALAEPTREGYVFLGWFADEAMTQKVGAIAADQTGDVTLYAKWEAQGPAQVDGVYQLASEADLRWFADKTQEDATLSAVLTADIALKDGTLPALGNTPTAKNYSGTFDGQGYKISDIKAFSSASATGLVKILAGGTIKNLTLEGEVAGLNTYNAVAAFVYQSKGGTIENCTNRIAITNKGNSATAGIVGKTSAGTTTIRDCRNEAAITAGTYAGGIIGEASSASTLVIEKCINTAPVSATLRGSYEGRAGGVIGVTSSSNPNVTITECANTGDVTGNYVAGGLLGNNTKGAVSISDCYNTGAVKVAGTMANAGGIVGSANSGTTTSITNSFVSGKVEGGKAQCAVAGNSLTTVQNVYYLEGIAAQETEAGDVEGATAVTADELLFLADRLGDKFANDAVTYHPVFAWQDHEEPATLLEPPASITTEGVELRHTGNGDAEPSWARLSLEGADAQWAAAVKSVKVTSKDDESYSVDVARADAAGRTPDGGLFAFNSDEAPTQLSIGRNASNPVFVVNPGDGEPIDVKNRWGETITYPQHKVYTVTIEAEGYKPVVRDVAFYTGASSTFSIIVDEDGDASTTDDQVVARIFSADELGKMSRFQNGSSQCGMTGFRTFSAIGVPVSDLLDAADVKVGEDDAFKLDTTDQFGRTFTYDQLFGERYFLQSVYDDPEVKAVYDSVSSDAASGSDKALRRVLAAKAKEAKTLTYPMISANYAETMISGEQVGNTPVPTQDNTAVDALTAAENRYRFTYGIKLVQEDETVTFVTGEGADQVEAQTVKSHLMTSTENTTIRSTYWNNGIIIYRGAGEEPAASTAADVIARPADPTREGYTFAGWYTDEACTDGNEFDFEANDGTVDKPTTLYAKWVEDEKPDYGTLQIAVDNGREGYQYVATSMGRNPAAQVGFGLVPSFIDGTDEADNAVKKQTMTDWKAAVTSVAVTPVDAEGNATGDAVELSEKALADWTSELKDPATDSLPYYSLTAPAATGKVTINVPIRMFGATSQDAYKSLKLTIKAEGFADAEGIMTYRHIGATELTVRVKDAADGAVTKTITLSEEALKDLPVQSKAETSANCGMAGLRSYMAEGVYLTDVLKAAGINFTDGMELYVRTTDMATTNDGNGGTEDAYMGSACFDYATIMGVDRYHYPAMWDTTPRAELGGKSIYEMLAADKNAWKYGANDTLAALIGASAQKVESPLIAWAWNEGVVAWDGTNPATQDWGDNTYNPYTSHETFRFLFGMKRGDDGSIVDDNTTFSNTYGVFGIDIIANGNDWKLPTEPVDPVDPGEPKVTGITLAIPTGAQLTGSFDTAAALERVLAGGTVALPAVSQDGYRFDGWFLDGYHFDKPITALSLSTLADLGGNVTVYAKMTKLDQAVVQPPSQVQVPAPAPTYNYITNNYNTTNRGGGTMASPAVAAPAAPSVEPADQQAAQGTAPAVDSPVASRPNASDRSTNISDESTPLAQGDEVGGTWIDWWPLYLAVLLAVCGLLAAALILRRKDKKAEE